MTDPKDMRSALERISDIVTDKRHWGTGEKDAASRQRIKDNCDALLCDPDEE